MTPGPGATPDGAGRRRAAATDARSDPGGARPGGEPVVVVGLGPVGATVALLLAREGVPVVAIERDVAVYPHPRAVALDDDALRVLQAAGVHHGDGLDLLPGRTVRIRGRGGRPLVELGPPPTTTGHPGLAFFRQPQLEGTLRERLEVEPLVDLRLGWRVLAVTDPGGTGGPASDGATDDGTAVLRVAAPDGEVSDLRAPWVLACDGGRSTIRTALGIRLRGRSSPSRWLVVDTDAPEDGDHPVGGDQRRSPGSRPAGPPHTADPPPTSPTWPAAGPPPARMPAGPPLAPEDFEFSADPAGPWVHGPLPGGAHRWEFLLDGRTERGEVEDPAVARAALARRTSGPVPTVRRAAVYAFHARVAERWRVGRVLLLGDAAHLAPPFAGQGLCAGLRDAGNVAWKVAAAWHGTASADLLGSYVAERRPHVRRTTLLAVALGLVVELRRPRAAALRDAVLGRLGATGAVRRWIDRGGWRPPGTLRRGLLARDRRHRHRAGEVFPQPDVRRFDDGTQAPLHGGTQAPLDDLLPRGWVLLCATDPGPGLRPPGVSVVPWATLDDDADLASLVPSEGVVLLRPDRVIFGTAALRDVAGLLDDLATSTAFAGPGPR